MLRQSWERILLYHIRDEDDPSTPQGAWRKRAACWDAPLWQMFDRDRESIRKALSICGRCPVTQECLAYAMRYREEYGVWGGMTARARVNRMKTLDQKSRK